MLSISEAISPSSVSTHEDLKIKPKSGLSPIISSEIYKDTLKEINNKIIRIRNKIKKLQNKPEKDFDNELITIVVDLVCEIFKHLEKADVYVKTFKVSNKKQLRYLIFKNINISEFLITIKNLNFKPMVHEPNDWNLINNSPQHGGYLLNQNNVINLLHKTKFMVRTNVV